MNSRLSAEGMGYQEADLEPLPSIAGAEDYATRELAKVAFPHRVPSPDVQRGQLWGYRGNPNGVLDAFGVGEGDEAGATFGTDHYYRRRKGEYKKAFNGGSARGPSGLSTSAAFTAQCVSYHRRRGMLAGSLSGRTAVSM